MFSTLRVALVHDWLNGMRGGEKVLEVFCEIFPQADLYALFYEKGKVSPVIASRRIFTSFVDRLPGARRYYRYLLPLFPAAAAGLGMDKKPYDLVISTSHCVAKGARVPKGALHLCYCFTPMRYAWSLQSEYLGRGMKRLLAAPVLGWLRRWDRRTAAGVDHFFAISRHVADRINRHYGRAAEVIYPPVDAEFYRSQPAVAAGGKKENYFLIVSALVPYKRIDLAVEAFNRLGWPLKIIGAGTEFAKLRRAARPNVEFLGWKSDADLREYYARARALVFPGEEDFGIVPLEAMACGTPVVAYGRGGATETVAAGTGLFFEEPTADSLAGALQRFEQEEKNFDPSFLRSQAERFDRREFRRRLEQSLREKWELFRREPARV